MKIVSVLIVMLILSGCTLSTGSGAMSTGERLYKEKCGGCHRLYKKEEFTPDKWAAVIESMKTKAHLSNDEKNEIASYLFK